MDLALSMSIVGGKAQVSILKELTASLRREYVQYAELLKLSKLQSGLSKDAERVLRRGQTIVNLLQQHQAAPVSLAEEVLLLYALRLNLLDELAADELKEFQQRILAFAQEKNARLLTAIAERPIMTPALEEGLREILNAYFARAA